MDNGMELRVKDYCAFCPDFDADVVQDTFFFINIPRIGTITI